jgi:hypothetical protein
MTEAPGQERWFPKDYKAKESMVMRSWIFPALIRCPCNFIKGFKLGPELHISTRFIFG